MTDIRKHGFESEAQWREYLAEIEEATTSPRPRDNSGILRELAAMRAEVAGLRERVAARKRRSRHPWPWRILAGSVFLLLLAMAARR